MSCLRIDAMTQGEVMQDNEPTRAQRMAAHLKADQARLIEQGVLPADIVRRTVKAYLIPIGKP